MRVGAVCLGGLTLPQLLARRAGAAPAGTARQARSVTIFGLLGGPVQHDTWDPGCLGREAVKPRTR